MVLIGLRGNHVFQHAVRAVPADILRNRFRRGLPRTGVHQNFGIAHFNQRAIARIFIAEFQKMYLQIVGNNRFAAGGIARSAARGISRF